MKAGLFDRAEAAWRELLNTPFEGDARLALLSLYERSHDWTNAVAMAQQLEQAGGGSFATRIAHGECELCEEADARGDTAAGDAALVRARAAAPDATRPMLLTGQRQLRGGDAAGALRSWDALREVHPLAFLLVVADYLKAAQQCGRTAQAQVAIRSAFEQTPAVELLTALQELEGEPAAAHLPRLLTQLREHPSLSAAQMLLAVPPEAWTPEAWQALRQALARSAGPLQRYRCAACGFEAQRYFWQCPGCLSWDSYPPQRIDAQ
jgi:lipopolysaccharide biosynthesis regulator YciM